MPHGISWVQVGLRGLRHHGCSLWDRKLGFYFWFGAPTQGKNYLSHGARPGRRSSIIHYFHWTYSMSLAQARDRALNLPVAFGWLGVHPFKLNFDDDFERICVCLAWMKSLESLLYAIRPNFNMNHYCERFGVPIELFHFPLKIKKWKVG